MFCYQRNFYSQCEIVTSELFTRLILSDEVNTRVEGYRRRLPELMQLKEQAAELRQQLEPLKKAKTDDEKQQAAGLKARLKTIAAKAKEISDLKTGLPAFMYQVREFGMTESKNGNHGRWRKQSAACLNGLFILDIDHVKDPMALVEQWTADCAGDTAADRRKAFFDAAGIVLCHVTPSGEGLRIVAKADAEAGNIADNQLQLSQKLGVECDKACKNADRLSFCPGFNDIIYINKQDLFNYENNEFDKKFGDQYRQGNSQPTNDGRDSDALPDPDERLEKGYRGVCYERIIECWYDIISKGKPVSGDRHRTLLQMAADLRYITDNDPKLLGRVLKLSDTGEQLCDEGREAEIANIATAACKRQMWQSIPQRLQPVLAAAGIQLDGAGADRKAAAATPIDYEGWWHRLEPLLEGMPQLAKIVSPLPEQHRLAGILAAGAMLGTYLTRCWWAHFDGKDYRLSYLVNIIGDAASGKSFVTELDRLLMAPMLAADRVGREWERQYKEDMKKRSASSKNAKQEAPDQQHPVIRYVPSTVSNAMLYRRLTDAIDNDTTGPDGQPMHLHVYTMEPELATALRAQVGSWAGKNDLELKSFHNEYAGVDYANDQSVNGIIQVNWNQVVTGTWESLSRKIKPSMVLDGLVTRLILFPMPSNEYQMLQRRNAYRDPDRECMMRTLGLRLEEIKGELLAEKMVDFCYEYECALTREAELEQDQCLDYFRKRIPVIMMRYGLVRLVLRHLDLALKGEPLPVDGSDLEFCRLIGDWCLMAQMRLFGQMVMDAREREQQQFVPRRRSHKVRELYAGLKEEFTREEMVMTSQMSNGGVTNTLRRWLDDGLIEKTGTNSYRKKFKKIPE